MYGTWAGEGFGQSRILMHNLVLKCRIEVGFAYIYSSCNCYDVVKRIANSVKEVSS
jgi:hypothetical protein